MAAAAQGPHNAGGHRGLPAGRQGQGGAGLPGPGPRRPRVPAGHARLRAAGMPPACCDTQTQFEAVLGAGSVIPIRTWETLAGLQQHEIGSTEAWRVRLVAHEVTLHRSTWVHFIRKADRTRRTERTAPARRRAAGAVYVPRSSALLE